MHCQPLRKVWGPTSVVPFGSHHTTSIPTNKLGFELTKDEALISALNREQYNYAKCARNLPRLGTRTFGTREGHRSSLLSVSYPSDVLGNQAGIRGQTG